MKIVIGYPPLESKKGIPFLCQNRQFQWAHDPWFAYPMVAAYGATMLKKAGYEVAWIDGIAEKWRFQRWLREIKKEKPDLIMLETKTPVIKKHWQIIDKLKSLKPNLKVVLVGDHVTALPEESFKKSKVDYVLTGGDYDFLFLNLVNHLTKETKLEPGIYYREGKKIENTGKFLLNHDLDKLPFVDRDLTHWSLYAYENSNYGQTPGTYTMFGRDCWWGKCSFCSWTTLYPGGRYRVMSPQRALDEIGYLLENYPIKEVMDDSGTFPTGRWLKEFCQGMIKRGYHQQIKIDCNLRFNAGLTQKDYNLMAKAGFRFLLFGLESANQETLNRINKNLKVSQIRKNLRMAKKAGLWPHLTVMFGYPWETEEEAKKTLVLAKDLFKKGWVDTLQATIVIPYPGTPLFEEAKKKKWLKTLDWEQYDMREPVMKTAMGDKQVIAFVNQAYDAFWSPEFVIQKLFEGLTSYDRFKYYLWLGLKFFSRKMDFSYQKQGNSFWKLGRDFANLLVNFIRGKPEKEMKVVMVSSIRPATNYTAYLVEALQKKSPRKAAVFVYTSQEKKNLQTNLKNVQLVWQKNLFYLPQILFQVAKDKPTHLHLQQEINMFGGLLTAAFFPLLPFFLRLMKKKVIVTVHAVIKKKDIDDRFLEVFLNSQWHFLSPLVQFYFLFLYQSIGFFANQIIVHTKGLKSLLVNDYHLQPEKIVVIPHGVPDEIKIAKKYQPTEKWTEKILKKPFLLSYGYLHKRKRIEILLQSFKLIKKQFPNLFLVIAGGTLQKEYEKELKSLVKKLKLEEKVILTGFVKEKDLRWLIEKSQFVLLPAQYSISASGPLAQVISHQRPVIVSDAGVFREEIKDGAEGLLVKNSAQDWAKGIEKLMKNSSLRKKISLNLKKKRQERKWSKVAELTYKVYRKI